MNPEPPSLPPVPTPFSKRWREFRIQALPFLTFLLIGTVAASLWRQVVVPHETKGESSPCHGRRLDSRTIPDESGRLNNPPPPVGSQTNGTNGLVDWSPTRD